MVGHEFKSFQCWLAIPGDFGVVPKNGLQRKEVQTNKRIVSFDAEDVDFYQVTLYIGLRVQKVVVEDPNDEYC